MLKPERMPRRRAFTLIEVLVVVAIIAVLVAILMPSLRLARERARSTQCLSNLKQVGMTMSYYLHDSKSFIPPFVYPIEIKWGPTAGYKDPYWFQYLPYKYLHNHAEVAVCPSDDPDKARLIGRGPFPELKGGRPTVVYSYAMNDELPIPKPDTYADKAALGELRDFTERYSPTLLARIRMPSETDYLNETTQHNLLSGSSTLRNYRRDHGGAKQSMNLLFVDSHGETRLFKNIWYGDFTTGFPKDSATWPGRFRQLWFGDARATGQIRY